MGHSLVSIQQRALLLTFLGLGISACGGPEAPNEGSSENETQASEDTDPPGSRRSLLMELRRSRDAARSSADGAGRAWIELPKGQALATATCGEYGRFSILFEAGPEGIAEGGFVRLTVPPFWGWSRAQIERENVPGYTTVEALSPGVELELRVSEWLDIFVRDRPLEAGEQIRIVYGAGNPGSAPDRYGERESRLWISVDGDGDGIGRVLADSPPVNVSAGAFAQLSLSLTSTAEPGGEVTLRISALDALGSYGVEIDTQVQLRVIPEEGLTVPASIRLGSLAQVLSLSPDKPGVYRVMAEAELPSGPGVWLSNPLLVAKSVAPIRWGDLHGHSNLSDGTGTPEDYLVYARDVAGLDIACLTDHDHWGMLFLDERPDMWERIRKATASANDPGKFVAILGFEWTSWVHGHRHVLYFADDGPVLSSIDERYETPTQLWNALEGLPALTFAHHSAGGPIPTNWDFAPDPRFETVTEIVSVHGSSESADSPGAIYNIRPGNTVRDVVFERGYQLGFIGSGDSHDGHPGLTHLAGGKGGLAAILTEDLTREGVRSALQSRRTYATSGQRIILRAAIEGHRMGSAFPVPDQETPLSIYVRAIGTAPIASIDVITNKAVIRQQTSADEDVWDLETLVELPHLSPGDCVYVRVVQADGACAWSSPFFLE